MLVLSAGSANELFVAACAAVLRSGAPVTPRGLATREVLGAHLHLRDPRCRLIDLPPARILNPAFAIAEAMWIMSGSDGAWIYTYNDALTKFTDDGVLQGAYGPRMRRWRESATKTELQHIDLRSEGHNAVDQLDEVRRLLMTDPDSRRAVVQLFDPGRDFRGYRDVPCTLGYRFYVRSGRLHMHTSMRSQDLWLGLGYDIFTATLLQEFLAGWLGAEVGDYHHHVDSLHLYDTAVDAASALPTHVAPSERFTVPAVEWADFDGALDDVIAGRRPPGDPLWGEYSTVMQSYRMWKSGDRSTARLSAISATGPLIRALQRWYDHVEARTAVVDGACR